MARPRRDELFVKVKPVYGELIEEMLRKQEATIFNSVQLKTFAKIRNESGLFNIVQPEYVEPNKTPKKIVKCSDAKVISKTSVWWVFKLI